MKAEKYFKTFFKVMPERLRNLQKIVREKRKREQLLLNAWKKGNLKELENQSIYLIELIGRDTLLHKAEKKKKNTLAHSDWKLSHAIDNYMKYIQVRPMWRNYYSFPVTKNKVEPLTDNLDNLRYFLKEILPNIKRLLDELDKIYIKKVNLLKEIAKEKKSASDYEILCREEESVCAETKIFFSDIQLRVRSFVNIVVQFRRQLELKKFSKLELAGSLCGVIICAGLGIVFSILAMGLLSSGVHALFFEGLIDAIPKTAAAVGSAALGAVGVLGFFMMGSDLKDEMRKLMDAAKFVSREMI